MSFLAKVFELAANAISSPRRPPPEDALALSELNIFPHEVILDIAECLDEAEAVCLSLSCRLYYDLLKGRQIQVEVLRSYRRYHFLALVERDLPDYVACRDCERLHSIKNAQRYYSFWKWGTMPCQSGDQAFGFYLHSGFSFTLFQMAMKQYRSGRDGSLLLKQLSRKSACSYKGSTRKTNFEVKIVDGCLLVRHQRIFKTSAAHTWKDHPDWEFDPFCCLTKLSVCPHLRVSHTFNHLGRKWSSTLDAWDEGRFQTAVVGEEMFGTIIPCMYCSTDLQIDPESSENGDRTINLTTWKNLGQGRASNDFRWWSHGESGIYLPWNPERLLFKSVWDRESPAEVFEGARRP